MRRHIESALNQIENRSLYQIICILIITILAAGLRFYKLGEWSLWIDEIFELNRAKNAFSFETFPTLTRMFIGAVIALRDTSEWNGRLAPALIGILSIPILFLPLKKLFRPIVALLTVLLLAISPWHILWSQHVRFYTLLMLLYTAGLLLFFFALEEDKFHYALIAGFILSLAVQERVMAFFYIPVIITYLLLIKFFPFGKSPGFRLKNFLPLLLPIAIFGSLDLYTYLQSGPIDVSREQIAAPDGYSAVNVFLTQFINDARLNPLWMVTSIINFIGVPVVFLSLFSGVYLFMQKNRAGIFILINILVPLVGLVLASLFIFSNDRYVFHTLVFWLILAGWGIKEIFSQVNKQGKLLALGILTLVLAGSLLQDFQYFKYQTGYRHDWKGAFQLVQTQKQDGDMVATSYPEMAVYYLGEEALDSDFLESDVVLQSCDRVWFVDALWGPPTTLQWLRNNSRLVGIHDVATPLRTLTMRTYLYIPDETCTNNTSDSD